MKKKSNIVDIIKCIYCLVKIRPAVDSKRENMEYTIEAIKIVFEKNQI